MNGDTGPQRRRQHQGREIRESAVAGLAAEGNEMVAKPMLVLLHGGLGADHSFFKPEFSSMVDLAQVIYLDQCGSGCSDRGD